MIINIASKIGEDLRTRAFFRRDIERLISPVAQSVTLDFSNVRFMSRSVADEICNLLEDYRGLKIDKMAGEVEKMYNVVTHGRVAPRVYSDDKITVLQMNSMSDLSEFLNKK
ncbi:MAG: hypothetical protein K2G74_06300 [Muribaculaceae bacterium]|nr:hypothetical protein [Muribaculaceae bacterium]